MEATDTVLDRGMRREIRAETERAGCALERFQPLKQSARGSGVEAGCPHEPQAQFVRFELLVSRIGARQPLKADLANPRRERPSGR